MKKQFFGFGLIISLFLTGSVSAAPNYNYTSHPAALNADVQADLATKEAELDNRVPYSGATQNVDLTGYILSADNIIGEQCQDRFEDTLDTSGWYNIVSNDMARIGFGSYGVFTIKWQVGSFQDSATFRVALDDTASSSVTLQLLSGAFSSGTVRVPRVRIYKKEGESAFQVALYYDHTGLSSPTEFNILLKEGENFPLNSAFTSPRVTFQMPSPDESYVLETTNALAVRGDGLTDFFVVDKDAQVGIGTATPTSELDVVGNAAITGNILLDGNLGIGIDIPTSKMQLDGGGVSTIFSLTNNAWIDIDADGWITTPGMDVFSGDLELWNEMPASDSIFYLYGQTDYYTMGTKYIDNDPDPDSDEFWISSGSGFVNPDFVMDNTGAITIADLTATSFSSPDVVPYTGATENVTLGAYGLTATGVTLGGADFPGGSVISMNTKHNSGNILYALGGDNATFTIDNDGDISTVAGSEGLGGGASFAGDVVAKGGFVTEGGSIVYDNWYHNWIQGATLFGVGTASPADAWYDFVAGTNGAIEIIDDYTTWANGLYLGPNSIDLTGVADQSLKITKGSQSFLTELTTDYLHFNYNSARYKSLTPITKDTYSTLEITYGQKDERLAPYKYSNDIFVGDVKFERDVFFDDDINVTNDAYVGDLYVNRSIKNEVGDGDMYYKQMDTSAIGLGHVFAYYNAGDRILLDLNPVDGADFQSFAITTTGDLIAANIITAGNVDGVDVSDLAITVGSNTADISDRVVYTGATQSVDLGANSITTTDLVLNGEILNESTDSDMYYRQKGNGIGYGHIFTYWNSSEDVTLLDLDAENGADFQSFAITTTGDLTAANIITAGNVDGVDVSEHAADTDIHYAQSAISITASQVSDFDTEVSNNTDVAANTTHRGESPTISSGTTAPTSTPGKVGDIYVDTTNLKLYFATGTTDSGDWTVAN